MIIKCQHDKNETWVAAHELPVFAQCDGCGHAPLPKHQSGVVALLLKEFIQFSGYKRDTTYCNGKPVLTGNPKFFLREKMKTVNVKKSDIGRFCRVVFDDVGAEDGVITRVDGNDDFRFLLLNNLQAGDMSNNGAPCVAVGKKISANNSGLDK
jgi:hypothetical protein